MGWSSKYSEALQSHPSCRHLPEKNGPGIRALGGGAWDLMGPRGWISSIFFRGIFRGMFHGISWEDSWDLIRIVIGCYLVRKKCWEIFEWNQLSWEKIWIFSLGYHIWILWASMGLNGTLMGSHIRESYQLSMMRWDRKMFHGSVTIVTVMGFHGVTIIIAK